MNRKKTMVCLVGGGKEDHRWLSVSPDRQGATETTRSVFQSGDQVTAPKPWALSYWRLLGWRLQNGTNATGK